MIHQGTTAAPYCVGPAGNVVYPGDALELGNAFQRVGDFEAAERLYVAALTANPDDAMAMTHYGQLQGFWGFPEVAERWHREALRRDPGSLPALFHLGTAQLSAGNLGEGFRNFSDARSLGAGGSEENHPTHGTRWLGEPTEGREVFIYHGHGWGDFLQFCRFVPEVAARERVALSVPPPMLRLVRTLAGDHRVVAEASPWTAEGDIRNPIEVPPDALHVSMMDLPAALGVTLETIPAAPYLAPDPVAVGNWRRRMEDLPGLRVGLAWSGNPTHWDDADRSIPFGLLEPLAGIGGVSFVSLQKGGTGRTARRPGDLPGLRVTDWTPELEDFADTAALIGALDLVISVDTSVAHLAGSIGAPVWLLNRFNSEWRWGPLGETTPWYPTMRIFRQHAPRCWGSVLETVRGQLEREAAR